MTDDEGRYRIIQLEPGSLQRCVLHSPALRRRRKRHLMFIAGKNVQLELTLVPEGVTVDPVTVTAD